MQIINSNNQTTIYYLTDTGSADEYITKCDRGQLIGYDIETYGHGLDPYRSYIRTVQLYFGGSEILVIDIRATGFPDKLLELLKSDRLLAIHNAKFEYKHTKIQTGIGLKNMWCTLLGAYVNDNGKYFKWNLKDVAARDIGLVLDKELQSSDWGADTLSVEQIQYAAWDAYASYHLALTQDRRAREEGNLYTMQVEMGVIAQVAEMELTGVYYDYTGLKQLGDTLQAELNYNLQQIQNSLPLIPLPSQYYTATGNLTGKAKRLYPSGVKPPETRGEFVEALKIAGVPEPIDPETNKRSLSKATYGLINHPCAEYMTKWGSLKQMVGTFIKAFLPDKENPTGVWNPVTGRVHPTWWQNKVTGRFSCSDPNLQQQPRKDKRFRRLTYAPPGWTFVKADYSQIELRVMAELSQDKNLIEAYCTGKDVHSMTASSIYCRSIEEYTKEAIESTLKEERQIGKNVNFGSIYGQWVKGLVVYIWNNAGILVTEAEAAQFLDAFFGLYPGVKDYHDRVRRDVIERTVNGVYYNRTLGGRIRYWTNVQIQERMNKYGDIYQTVRCNEMINHPDQGTVGDAVKIAMTRLHKENPFPGEAYLIMQVHDELDAIVKDEHVDEYKTFMQNTMVESMQLFVKTVPIEVDINVGRNWAGE